MRKQSIPGLSSEEVRPGIEAIPVIMPHLLFFHTDGDLLFTVPLMDSRGLLYTYGAPLTTKVTQFWHCSIMEFGLPARCRSDKGGENVKVHNSMWPIIST